MKQFMCHWKRTQNEWEIIPLVTTSNKSLNEIFEGPAWPEGLLYDATVEADDAVSARLKFRQLLIDYLDATVKNYNRIMSGLREKLVKDEGSVYGKSLIHWSDAVDPHRGGILDEDGLNPVDKCFKSNANTRLFHGEDILALMKRFNIGALFDIPPVADSIESISEVRLKNFIIVNGQLTFTVQADVKFKEDV